MIKSYRLCSFNKNNVSLWEARLHNARLLTIFHKILHDLVCSYNLIMVSMVTNK